MHGGEWKLALGKKFSWGTIKKSNPATQVHSKDMRVRKWKAKRV